MTDIIDLFSLTEQTVEQRWPLGWQEDFAKRDFIYVTGLVEFFAKRNLTKPDRIRAEILPYASKAIENIPQTWLNTYPGTGNRAELVPNEWGLDELGGTVVRKVAAQAAATMPKSMLILLCVHHWGKKRDEEIRLEEHFQLRLANCYVPFLSRFLHKLSEVERLRLIVLLGGQDLEVTLDDLAMGFPTTYEFSSCVVSYLKSLDSGSLTEDEKSLISLNRYRSTQDVTDSVKTIGAYVQTNERRRPAKGEKPKYYWN